VCHLTLVYLYRCVFISHSSTCTGVSLSHARLPAQVCYLTLVYLHRCVFISHSATCTGVPLYHTRLPVQVCYYVTLVSHWSVSLWWPRRCPTLSNPVSWQNWMVARLGYTLWMKTLFPFWPTIVHDTYEKKKKTLQCNTGDACDVIQVMPVTWYRWCLWRDTGDNCNVIQVMPVTWYRW